MISSAPFAVRMRLSKSSRDLFTATGFTGTLIDCDEGALEWIDRDALYALPMWAGDRIFLRLIASPHPFFSLKLRYENGVLIEAALDGRPLEL